MSTAEVRTSSDLGKSLTAGLLDDFYSSLNGKSPQIRQFAVLCGKIYAAGKSEGLAGRDLPFPAHIGDVKPDLIGGEGEERFAYLKDAFALLPGTEGRQRFLEYRDALEQSMNREGVFMSSYDPKVLGLWASRAAVAEHAGRIGLDVYPDSHVIMTEGGTGAWLRTCLSQAQSVEKKYGRSARLLSPVPTYTMAFEPALQSGMEIQVVDVNDAPGQQLTAERLDHELRRRPNEMPDSLYLVPASNPMATVYEPDGLKDLLAVAMQHNPDMYINLDSAYLMMIDPQRAKALIQAVEKAEALGNSFFLWSYAKSMLSPGYRYGAVVTPDVRNRDLVNTNDLSGVYTTYSRHADLSFAATAALVGEYEKEGQDPFADVRLLFRQRQEAFIEVLKELDPDGRFLKGLDQALTRHEVPLYLWLETQVDILPREVIKELMIMGIPGGAFGEQRERHLRLSMGGVSTEQIKNLKA